MSTKDQPGTGQPSIEDRVRTATRAGASLIHEVRPLTAPVPAHLRRRPAPAPRRWVNWGVPLVAAAAVVAVALSLVAVRQFRSASPPSPAATAPAAVPRYFAAISPPAGKSAFNGPLIVGDDRTGKTIATISPPRGLYFTNVKGTSDDRTFVVVAASRTQFAIATETFTWYLVRITPGAGHPYQLIQLPIKTLFAYNYALSPDGRELAVETQPSVTENRTPIAVVVYSVPSGVELHAWATSKDILSGLGQSTLSWLSGGRQLILSVGRFTVGQDYTLQLRELDVTGSGTDLIADSRALGTIKNSEPSTCVSLRITPDGGTAVCATQYAFLAGNGSNAGCADGGLRFTAYSVRTGQPVRVLYQYRGACHNGLSYVLWTDPSATQVIGVTEINVANEGGKQVGQLGVITGGHLRPLKLPQSILPEAYGGVAF